MTSRAMLLTSLASTLLLSACSVSVKKNESGEDKKVDINTPFGGIHVDKSADARDTGLPVYPGSRIREDNDRGDEKSANVNISSMGYGLRVVAIQYESDDPPAKVVAYYKDQLKKYGSVLECHTTGHHPVNRVHAGSSRDDNPLKCEGNDSGSTVELKAGTESNQHIVSIEPKDRGSDFALVYVQTHGKDTI